MKKITLYILFIISNIGIAQNGFETWNKNYTFINPIEVIQSEINYAKKIEKDTIQSQYYVSAQKYRFVAEFTGNERNISQEKIQSMANVVSLKFGRKDFITYEIVNSEFEFLIDNIKVWMPIQTVLKTSFQGEIPKGHKVLLYTLFLNEHTMEGVLNNNFFISEFTNNWE